MKKLYRYLNNWPEDRVDTFVISLFLLSVGIVSGGVAMLVLFLSGRGCL